MISRKYRKTSNGNKHKNSRDPGKNTRIPTKKSPENERINIKIPKNTQIYQYLNGRSTIINIPKWRRLEALLQVAEQTREDLDTVIFDTFLGSLEKLHPDKIDKLKRLRPLILWHILWDDVLDDEYYDKLKEL